MDLSTYLSTFSERVKEYPKNKDEAIRVRDSMIVHTRGVYPKKLLEIKRPNEQPEETKYRLANHRTITKEGINNAIDGVYRTLINSNGDIIPSPKISEYLREKKFYLFESDGKSYPFIQLWFEYFLRLMFDDANGYFGFFPVNSEDSNLIPQANPENQKVELIAIWVDCDRVLHTSNDFISFKAKRKWEVQQDKKKVLEDYFFVCTNQEILRMIPFWDGKKIDYRKEIYYVLAVDKSDAFITPPLRMMGGNMNLTVDEIEYHESYFSGYVPFGDEAICAFSDNQVVRARYSYPIPEYKGQICTECKGTTKVRNKKGELIQCGKCNGISVAAPFSPFGGYMNMPPASGENSDYALHPAVTFHSPDVAILEHNWNAWKEFREMAKEAVNLVQIPEAQSGVAKEIDREEKYDMLYKLSQAVYNHIKWSLTIIESYREKVASDRKGSTVTPPTSFQLLTEGEMMAEMTTLIEKDAPSVYTSEVAINLSKKVFNGNQKAQRVIEILTVWDVLFGKNTDQISQLRASGSANQTDSIRHLKGYQILLGLSNQPNFDRKIEEIIKEAETLLVASIPKLITITNDSGVPV